MRDNREDTQKTDAPGDRGGHRGMEAEIGDTAPSHRPLEPPKPEGAGNILF